MRRLAALRALISSLPNNHQEVVSRALDLALEEERQKAAVSRTRIRATAKARQSKALATAKTVQARTIAELQREAAALTEEMQALREGFRDQIHALVGGSHVPPPGARSWTSAVARPSIKVSCWKDGEWQCLRLEERTVGHNRERAFISPVTKRPALRSDPTSLKWMKWVQGIAAEAGFSPLDGKVRVVFFPGLAYTFIAWRPVPDRDASLLHPMDPDNACKTTIDGLQAAPFMGPQSAYGAFFNDAQVVDLLVLRLPQDGQAPVDRLLIANERRRARRAKKAGQE